MQTSLIVMQYASHRMVSGSFHSLFKVLFIFPSRYFFAISLPPVFSLRWDLPPIRAAFPSYPTRLKQTCTRTSLPRLDGTFTLHGRHFHATYLNWRLQSAQNTTPVKAFHIGLFPVRSPLLRESWLVSFPPLNYMLKFSGSSYLMWDPKVKNIFSLMAICLFRTIRASGNDFLRLQVYRRTTSPRPGKPTIIEISSDYTGTGSESPRK